MAVMKRSDFGDLFASLLPYLDEVFDEEWGEPPAMLEGIWDVRTSNRMKEQTTGVTGFGYSRTRQENEPVTYDERYQAHDKTFTHSERALGYQVSKRARRDDLYGIFVSATQSLARSMRTTFNKDVWNVLNNGFASETSPDGKYLFSASHPLIGGTYSNLGTGDFSIATFRTAMNSYNDLRDDRNLEIELDPAYVIANPQNQWIVNEILGSPEKPDTANRAMNVMYGLLEPRYCRYISDTDSWFIVAPAMQNGLRVYMNQPMETDQDMDFDTDAAKYKATIIHSQGAVDWRGLYGSAGA